MMDEYFRVNNQLDNLHIQREDEKKEKELKSLIMSLAHELQSLYKSILPKSKIEAEAILNEFMTNKFKPEITAKCDQLKLEKDQCFPIKREWNNAALAAFLTYENHSDDLENLQKKLGINLKDFYKYIVKKYEEYENLDSSEQKGFSQYLLKASI